jgi:predicted transglutaminase-like cysteine proteinase
MELASKRLTIFAVILATALFGMVAPALAISVDFSHPAFASAGRAQTSTPVGHAEFCHFHRNECGPNLELVSAIELTERNWQQLLAINARFNTSITPVTDQQLYHVPEFWTYPNGFGDCEDFVLAKRRSLIEAGWPASTLLITVVRQENGEGHAVLMVRTDRGDLILDNQDALIKLWTDTPYQYLKRQSQTDAGKWVDLYDSATRLASLHG